MRSRNRPRRHEERGGLAGFTAVELLTSVVILALIAITVSIDIGKNRMREELDAAARQISGSIRNLQSAALAARTVKTCRPAATAIVCDLSTNACGGSACGTELVPLAVGMKLDANSGQFSTFAEVELVLEDRRQHAGELETTGRVNLASGRAGTTPVRVTSLMAGSTSLSTASVAFERQSGSMRINACDTPALAPACGATPEPITLDITLTHSGLGKSIIIRLNRLTGRVSIE